VKIELEIPEWAAGGRLIILSGVELVASKVPWEDYWLVKEKRCERCGLCCFDYPPTPFGHTDEGHCKMLVLGRGDIWECKAGTDKPYRCLRDPFDVEDCSIIKKKVKA
jgi:hypothetical protein